MGDVSPATPLLIITKYHGPFRRVLDEVVQGLNLGILRKSRESLARFLFALMNRDVHPVRIIGLVEEVANKGVTRVAETRCTENWHYPTLPPVIKLISLVIVLLSSSST